MRKGLILGFFDGVHVGHQAVIKSAVEFCEETVLITFTSSPAKFFQKDFSYILSRENSLKKISALGVNKIVELDFSKIVQMSAEEYLEYLIKEFAPVSISTGFNHTFGKNKQGNAEFLTKMQEKYNYKYFCVSPKTFENHIISSTFIRDLLKKGDVQTANKLLGSRFLLEGKVIHGQELGRKIGFPTANINYPQDIVKLPYGVYCGSWKNKKCVINWGIKPTVSDTQEPVAEVHIIDFDGDLYGQNIEVEILKKIRDEKSFSSLEELKCQIEKDVNECLEL